KQTQETIDNDGWLHTGDLGKLNDGFLSITGRIKELIITAGGENIPPVIIENNIKKQINIISNCMVVGDGKKFLTCFFTLICADNSTTSLQPSIIKENNVNTMVEAINDIKINEVIKKGINSANLRAISNAQKVQKFTILNNDFSIDSGELGPTLK